MKTLQRNKLSFKKRFNFEGNDKYLIVIYFETSFLVFIQTKTARQKILLEFNCDESSSTDDDFFTLYIVMLPINEDLHAGGDDTMEEVKDLPRGIARSKCDV